MNTVEFYRVKKELTQAELAKKLGFTRQYINNVEKKRTKMSKSLAIQLANVLECSPIDILGEKNFVIVPTTDEEIISTVLFLFNEAKNKAYVRQCLAEKIENN